MVAVDNQGFVPVSVGQEIIQYFLPDMDSIFDAALKIGIGSAHVTNGSAACINQRLRFINRNTFVGQGILRHYWSNAKNA